MWVEAVVETKLVCLQTADSPFELFLQGQQEEARELIRLAGTPVHPKPPHRAEDAAFAASPAVLRKAKHLPRRWVRF